MKKQSSGLLLAGAMGALALNMGQQLPLLGSSLLALLTGLALSGVLRQGEGLQPGLHLASKKGLQYSIVLLGLRLSFSDIQSLGLSSYRFSLPLLLLVFTLAWWLGRRLQLTKNLTLLIAFGTAICGGSAIAAAAPILDAEEEEVGLALSTIFLFNMAALLIFPALGQLLDLNQEAFGLWAGTAINDTSSVVATAYGYGQTAGEIATIVKLARTLLIVPTCLAFSLRRFGQWQSGNGPSVRQLFPSFIIWFLLASLLSSLNVFPAQLLTLSKPISQWLMAASLFAVGSKMSLGQLKRAGLSPLVLGGLVWGCLSLASLFLQNGLSTFF